MTRKISPRARAIAAQMKIEATCSLADGRMLTAIRDGGMFSWKIGPDAVTVYEAQKAMVDDSADAWEFTDAGSGLKFEMRRPTQEQAIQIAQAKEIEVIKLAQATEIANWNADVERKKAEKKSAKKAAKDDLMTKIQNSDAFTLEGAKRAFGVLEQGMREDRPEAFDDIPRSTP